MSMILFNNGYFQPWRHKVLHDKLWLILILVSVSVSPKYSSMMLMMNKYEPTCLPQQLHRHPMLTWDLFVFMSHPILFHSQFGDSKCRTNVCSTSTFVTSNSQKKIKNKHMFINSLQIIFKNIFKYTYDIFYTHIIRFVLPCHSW